MAGDFDFLHIRSRTAGSSNELSFDVLDQLSSEAGAKAKAPKPPKSSQGSYHGVAGTSTLTGQAEVERRKRARRSSRMRIQVVAAVAVIVLVGVAVYAGVRFQGEHSDFAGRYDRLIDRLNDADATLARVDSLMVDPMAAEGADDRASVLAGQAALATELARIRADADDLVSASLSEQDEMALGQLSEASSARADMLAAAGEAFTTVSEGERQVAVANSAWNSVLAADQLAREAATAANKATTQEATQAALDTTREARAGFEEALGELHEISWTHGIDFTDQEAYLDKKMEALDNAIATGEALLAGNREAATAANDAYNAADGEAADLAEGLPPSIGGLVSAHFTAEVAQCQARYDEARARTIQADSTIREYLATR